MFRNTLTITVFNFYATVFLCSEEIPLMDFSENLEVFCSTSFFCVRTSYKKKEYRILMECKKIPAHRNMSVINLLIKSLGRHKKINIRNISFSLNEITSSKLLDTFFNLVQALREHIITTKHYTKLLIISI